MLFDTWGVMEWITIASGVVTILSFITFGGQLGKGIKELFGIFWSVLIFPKTLVDILARLSDSVDGLKTVINEVHDLALLGNQKALMAFEDAPVAMFECDMTGACIWSNHALQNLFGLEAHEVLGEGWLSALHPDDIQPTFKRWMETISNWVPYRARYRVINCKTRKEVLVEASAHVIRNDGGKPLTAWGKVLVVEKVIVIQELP